MNAYEKIAACTGFDWDEGNVDKNWETHNVSAVECEQVFFNYPMVVAPDLQHSQSEPRCFVLGHTDARRTLFLVFTIRGNLIRVISARDMNKKERRRYDSHGKET